MNSTSKRILVTGGAGLLAMLEEILSIVMNKTVALSF